MFILSLGFINHAMKLLNVIMATGFTKMHVCTKDYLTCNMEKKENNNTFICRSANHRTERNVEIATVCPRICSPYLLTYLLTYLITYLLTYSMEQSPS